MLAASTSFALSGSLVKLVGETQHPLAIAFFRCLFDWIVLWPMIARAGLQVYRTTVPHLHLSRSLAGTAAMALGFVSVTELPLALASALSFTKPLFMLLIGVLILREAAGWQRWLAAGAGFAGVLVIVDPLAVLDGPRLPPGPILAGIGGAAGVALVAALIKTLSITERPLTILAWFGMVSTLVLLIPLFWVWRTPDGADWLVLLAIGGLSTLAQGWAIQAFKRAETTAIAGLDYSRLLLAALFGWLIFAEVPAPGFWLGGAIILGASLALARYEARYEARRVTG